MTRRFSVTTLVPAAAGVALALIIVILVPVRPVRADAESTGFQPAELALPSTGSSATATIVATGIPSGTSGVQFLITAPSSISVTEPKCTGLFDGATPLGPVAAGEGVVLACIFLDPSRSITTAAGELMTVTLTRFGPGDGEVAFASSAAFKTEYIAGGVSQGPGRLGTLRVSGSGVPGSAPAGSNPPAQATATPPAATQAPAGTQPASQASPAAGTPEPAGTPGDGGRGGAGGGPADATPEATAPAEAAQAVTATAVPAGTTAVTVTASATPGLGTAATTQVATPVGVADGTGDDEGGNSPAIIFIVVAVVVVAGGVIAYYVRRKRGNPPVV